MIIVGLMLVSIWEIRDRIIQPVVSLLSSPWFARLLLSYRSPTMIGFYTVVNGGVLDGLIWGELVNDRFERIATGQMKY